MATPFTSPDAALKFMLGGKSFTTLVSSASGQRFTYRVELADKKNPTDVDCYFVAVLNGPDNWVNYKYIGIVKNNAYRWTSKSKIAEDAPSVKAFNFCFDRLTKNSIAGFEVWHEGKCGRCGRKLTVPESIASGFGPECIGMVGHAMAAAVGSAAPQAKLNFDGTDIKTVNGGVRMYGTPGDGTVKSKIAQAGTLPQTEHSETEIDRRVKLYAAMFPEDYTQGDMLTADEAYKLHFNRIKLEMLKGGN